MVGTADAVVLCGVPFGPGNVVNLALAEQALADGKAVYIMEGVAARDYTPGRDAVGRVERLMRGGAKVWTNVTDLLRQLPHQG